METDADDYHGARESVSLVPDERDRDEESAPVVLSVNIPSTYVLLLITITRCTVSRAILADSVV